MERIADFFSRSGSYAEGRAHCQKILVARGQLAAILQVSQRVLGPDHPRTRSIQADLAAGELLREAEQLLREAEQLLRSKSFKSFY